MSARNACTFSDRGYCIEIVYWLDSQGHVAGEAYFRKDDFCAPIIQGHFAHPYSGQRYQLHVPSRFGKSEHALLDVLRWQQVGACMPVAAA